MAKIVLRRLVALGPVFIGVSLIVFWTIRMIPGDPATTMLGTWATEEDVNRLRKEMQLDKPIYVQYVTWIGKALQGDMGRSLQNRRPVVGLVMERFQNTVVLTAAGIFISSLVGILVGVFAATRQNSILDRLITAFALFGQSMPVFWFGLLLIVLFSVSLRWFPTGGMYSAREAGGLPDLLHHLVLPALTLGLVSAGIVARMTRSAMLEVLHNDYIRTARAKGLTERLVISRHALKNAMIPVITVIGLQVGYLLGGAVITETVFSWPGAGLQLFEAISSRDYPLIQGSVLFISVVFVLVNLVVDLIASYLNPQARFG